MYRRPVMDRTAFDVVVKPGQSIQDAIEKAPETPTNPFKILILKGNYNQKVIIDRPNIVLVGESRDSTVIVLAETAKTRTITQYHGKPVGNGVIVLQEGADDCVISGLTVYNNYGTTVENTTTHQMSIFGRATRTIVINCNVWADGNDALGRRQAMECIIMPIFICVVPEWIFFARAGGVMLPAVGFMAMAVH